MRNKKVKKFLIENNTYLIFLALFFICALTSDNFLTTMNIRNIALQQAAPICVAIGMLFVILTGGIDLSVGSIMALGSSLSAVLVTNYGVDWRLAILLSIAVGCILGLGTGVLVAFLNFQGFVASLAMMTIARGSAFMLTNGAPVRIERRTLDLLVSKDKYFPVLFISLFIILLFMFIQKFTSYGRIVIATGSNSTAVSLSGIPVKKYLVSVYTVSAMLAAFAGVFMAARSSTGNATVGMGQELDAIAACVIGGASLAGGRGGVLKTVVGALVLALIGNIMNLMAIPSYPQDIIKGFIIIIAVLLQVITSKTEKTV